MKAVGGFYADAKIRRSIYALQITQYHHPMALLIDGHNLIGQMQDISLSDPDDEAKLVKQLRMFGLLARKQITVIFDPNPHDSTPRTYADIQQYDSVKVIYAMPGQKADDLIRNLAGKIRDKQGTVVVTSDNAVAKFARACGLKVQSSQDFIKVLKSQLAERIFSDAKPSPTRKENKEWAEVFKDPPPSPSMPAPKPKEPPKPKISKSERLKLQLKNVKPLPRTTNATRKVDENTDDW